MGLSAQIDKLFAEKQGYCHWSKLNTFLSIHRTELDNKEQKRILDRIEQYRSEHNSRYPNDIIRSEDIKSNI